MRMGSSRLAGAIVRDGAARLEREMAAPRRSADGAVSVGVKLGAAGVVGGVVAEVPSFEPPNEEAAAGLEEPG